MSEKLPIPKKSPSKSFPHTSHSSVEEPAQLNTQPEQWSATDILHLQPMIGNQAIHRMIKGDNKRIQRVISTKLDTEQNTTTVNDLKSLCSKFGIEKKDLIAPIKTALFQGALFPALYKTNHDQNKGLQGEMQKIVFGLDDLIAASASQTVITAPSGDANAVATQLFAIIGPSITAARLNQFEYFRNTTTLGQVQGTNYMAFLNIIVPTLAGYNAKIPKYGYSEEDNKMRNRVTQFTERAKSLLAKLNTATQAKQAQMSLIPLLQKSKRLEPNWRSSNMLGT
jgi:hypothetical protein